MDTKNDDYDESWIPRLINSMLHQHRNPDPNMYSDFDPLIKLRDYINKIDPNVVKQINRRWELVMMNELSKWPVETKKRLQQRATVRIQTQVSSILPIERYIQWIGERIWGECYRHNSHSILIWYFKIGNVPKEFIGINKFGDKDTITFKSRVPCHTNYENDRYLTLEQCLIEHNILEYKDEFEEVETIFRCRPQKISKQLIFS